MVRDPVEGLADHGGIGRIVEVVVSSGLEGQHRQPGVGHLERPAAVRAGRGFLAPRLGTRAEAAIGPRSVGRLVPGKPIQAGGNRLFALGRAAVLADPLGTAGLGSPRIEPHIVALVVVAAGRRRLHARRHNRLRHGLLRRHQHPPSRETTSITSPAFSPSRGQRIFRSFPTSAGPIRSVISAVGRSLARRCKTTVPPLSGSISNPDGIGIEPVAAELQLGEAGIFRRLACVFVALLAS